MTPSVVFYLALLATVGIVRLFEVRLSSHNQKRMTDLGVQKIGEPHFRWMVLLHAGVLLSAALEVLLLHRPWIPPLAAGAGAAFMAANLLRWWVIRTLSGHWNVQVMASSDLGVVTGGPYKWVRHPNYLAVVLELLALPLIHTAWITAIWATLANTWILKRRISVEESVLMANPVYRVTMGSKRRFIPWLF